MNLNNAIRCIEAGDMKSALENIANAIDKAGGYYHDDTKLIIEALRRENK